MMFCYIVAVPGGQECSLVHSMSTMTRVLVTVQLTTLEAGGSMVVMMPISTVLGFQIPGLILGSHNIKVDQM